MTDVLAVARLQWLVVASAWLFVLSGLVRARVRRLPHRRWVAALETLREMGGSADAGEAAERRRLVVGS